MKFNSKASGILPKASSGRCSTRLPALRERCSSRSARGSAPWRLTDRLRLSGFTYEAAPDYSRPCRSGRLANGIASHRIASKWNRKQHVRTSFEHLNVLVIDMSVAQSGCLLHACCSDGGLRLPGNCIRSTMICGSEDAVVDMHLGWRHRNGSAETWV